MMRWWRSHSIRVRLSLWYVATMVIVLGVYAAAILAFVNRTASQTLDQQLGRVNRVLIGGGWHRTCGQQRDDHPTTRHQPGGPVGLHAYRLWRLRYAPARHCTLAA